MGGKSETTATSGAAPNAVGGIVSDQNTPLANGDVGTLGSESADQVFQRAAELLRRGDHGEALTSLNTVVDTLKDDAEKGRQRSDPSLGLAAHSGRAMCFTALGQRADAVQAHSLVLAMAAESKLSNWEATAWGDLGDAYAAADMESDGMEARSFAELLVKEGKGVARVDKAGVGQGDVPHLDKILGSVDLSEWKDTDIYKSVTSFEKMAAVAAQMKSEGTPLLIRALGSLGSQYRELGQYRLSTRLLESAHAIAGLGGINDRVATMVCCRALGQAYSDWALRYIRESKVVFETYSDTAIDWNRKARAAAALEGDQASVQGAHLRIAVEHSRQKAHHRAIEQLRLALALANRRGDVPSQADCHRKIGIEFQALAQHRQALKEHERDLELALKLDDPHAEGRSCRNLGVSYAALKQFGKALKLLQHAERIAMDGQHWDEAALARIEIGEACSRSDQMDAAAASFTGAMELVDAHTLPLSTAQRAALGAGDACLKIGHFVEALHFFDRHLAVAVEQRDPQLEARARVYVSNATYWLQERWGSRPNPNVTRVLFHAESIAAARTGTFAHASQRRSSGRAVAAAGASAGKGECVLSEPEVVRRDDPAELDMEAAESGEGLKTGGVQEGVQN